jgi:hypothetical protein
LDSKDGRTAFSRENAGCLTWGLDREARGLVVLLPLLLHQPLQSARHREGHLQIKQYTHIKRLSHEMDLAFDDM